MKIVDPDTRASLPLNHPMRSAFGVTKSWKVSKVSNIEDRTSKFLNIFTILTKIKSEVTLTIRKQRRERSWTGGCTPETSNSCFFLNWASRLIANFSCFTLFFCLTFQALSPKIVISINLKVNQMFMASKFISRGRFISCGLWLFMFGDI